MPLKQRSYSIETGPPFIVELRKSNVLISRFLIGSNVLILVFFHKSNVLISLVSSNSNALISRFSSKSNVLISWFLHKSNALISRVSRSYNVLITIEKTKESDSYMLQNISIQANNLAVQKRGAIFMRYFGKLFWYVISFHYLCTVVIERKAATIKQ